MRNTLIDEGTYQRRRELSTDGKICGILQNISQNGRLLPMDNASECGRIVCVGKQATLAKSPNLNNCGGISLDAIRLPEKGEGRD